MKHKDFGGALRAARIAKGLSMTAVSTLTGISRATISFYENRGTDPLFSYMVLICDLCDVDLNNIANTVRPASHHRDGHSKSVSNRHIKSATTLGAALKAGRESKRLSTRAVDALIGVGYVNISRYETDESRPSFTTTVRMCDLYGIYLDDLADILRNISVT